MKIEFEKIDPYIKVHEHIIRVCDFNDEGEKYKTTCFQARISPALKEDDSISCSFSFYNDKNEFLGVDTDSIYGHENSHAEPFPISFDLNPPRDSTNYI